MDRPWGAVSTETPQVKEMASWGHFWGHQAWASGKPSSSRCQPSRMSGRAAGVGEGGGGGLKAPSLPLSIDSG